MRLDPDPGGRPEKMVKGRRLTGPKVAPRVEENLEALEALGYVE